ncbi:hypothetical protein FIV42_12300 [Persicimonas caeni]|uniref:MoxR-vWA-beta-propeller ternary system domain-containing protein n=1 Tax=Persicimonas caeni TaxID=2292766 RepID=A0A4Y6PTZ9_PERCE|nr:hypothetical protein [Persicimonas caeni]QDG51497.1 hypothetical protein FIV42_12300 [Persicimonas caeni]QED32718.1 hypothetical protein FRD00_12295 [Persicimonas caeni]
MGFADVAAALAERLVGLSRQDRPRFDALEAAACDGLLIVVAQTEWLPWVDGLHYLGREPAAPRLLVPTALEPDVPLDLLERAVVAHHGEGRFAICARPSRIISLRKLAPIDVEKLQTWAERGAL